MSRSPPSLPRSRARADTELTLSGVLQVPTNDGGRICLAAALELSLQVVRLVAATHDQGKVVGVLDAQHLICEGTGLKLGGRGGNPTAPELRRGEMPDRLTDVYAVGALMYRLFTGRRVEQARVIEPPSHFNPAVDSPLDQLVLATLDEDPSLRPHSAREIERGLLAVYADLGLEAEAKTEATELIEAGARAKARAQPQPTAASWRTFDPDATLDADEPSEPDWRPPRAGEALKKRWLAGAAGGLLLLLLLAWPSGKNEARPARATATPAQVTAPPATQPQPPRPPQQPAVQARLAEGETLKVGAPPKKSARRARR